MKIYVASSWRNNELYPKIISELRELGHQVYDFKQNGFAWEDLCVGTDCTNWTPEQHIHALEQETSKTAFKRDMTALSEADVCVLVLPCGRSAHLELGYAVGAKKHTIILDLEPCEPDLMYLMCDKIFINYQDFKEHMSELCLKS